MTTNLHSTCLTAAAVLLAATGFVAGSLSSADAGPAHGHGLTAKKVRKIADKEIAKKAPGLHVASADSATSAAGIGGATIRTFGVTIHATSEAAPVPLATVGDLQLVGRCSSPYYAGIAAIGSGGTLQYETNDGYQPKMAQVTLAADKPTTVYGYMFDGVATLTYRSPGGGSAVTAQVGWTHDPATATCLVQGTVTGG